MGWSQGKRPRLRHRHPRRRRASRHAPKYATRSREQGTAYINRQALLSRGENAFFGALREAVAGHYLIMCKVRLADLITCSDAAWRCGGGRPIAQKHVDFVLCDPQTTRFVLGIELDDRSHDRPDRRRRDAFVNDVMAGAGIRLLRIPATSQYSAWAIRRRLQEACAPKRTRS